MLTEVDRLLVATPDSGSAGAAWRSILGAEEVLRERTPALSAVRRVFRVGRSDVEFLEPDGGRIRRGR